MNIDNLIKIGFIFALITSSFITIIIGGLIVAIIFIAIFIVRGSF